MITRLLAAFLCSVLSTAALAYCDGGYPNLSVRQEVRESAFVVVGTLLSRMLVVDPVADPEGYEATLFQVKIKRILHGKPPAYARRTYFSIYNVNTSARFPIDEQDIGKDYVLFVRTGADGYWVDSCGHSQLHSESAQLIKQLSRIGKHP
ncbi:hypothetical protein KSF73_12025 [Burkholderiaceae bacterium DAT-1]|nr:hypothetical protein [Burkholderiaceae bacterium DAT-1]